MILKSPFEFCEIKGMCAVFHFATAASLGLRPFNEFKQLMAYSFFKFLTATRSRRYASYLTSMLTDLASEFLPELADFRAILAEIRNCLGVTPTIRLSDRG